MYAAWSNQLPHILHYVLALAVVLLLGPGLMFRRDRENGAEQLVSNALRGLLLLLAIGYALVILKLFEVISLVVLIALIAARKWLTPASGEQREQIWARVSALFFDYTDGKFSLKRIAAQRLCALWRRTNQALGAYFRDPGRWTAGVLLLLVAAVSAYTRFYDALTHAAPAMSDAYVTLAWMKYIDQRVLFHDGIYPQGFHIYLAVLMKFASIDALYVLKYTGPLNSLLTVAGFYFAVARMSGNRFAGIAAAAAFGLLGELLEQGAWTRQASTNSQEFAFVFVLPTLYFAYRYVFAGKRSDLLAMAAGASLIGLVHTLAFGFVWLGIAALLAAELVRQPRSWLKKAGAFALTGLVSGLLSLLPLGIGYAMGRKAHASSAEYLVSKVREPIPFPSMAELGGIDWLVMGCVVLLFVAAFASGVSERASSRAFGRALGQRPSEPSSSQRSSPRFLGLLFAAWFGFGISLVYYFGGPLTGSTLIDSRSGELWALTAPVCIGMSWAALAHWLAPARAAKWLEAALSAAWLALILAYVPPAPIVPYKMESDAAVEQYLAISEAYRPKTWMMVYSLKEGQNLALGGGFHMYVNRPVEGPTLIKSFDPEKPHLTKYGELRPSDEVPADVFLFYEKRIFQVAESNAIYPVVKPEYDMRQQEMVQLKTWIDNHQASGHAVDICFENEELAVYHLHRELTREEVHKSIWR